MAFDECTKESDDKAKALHALTRTHRWLLESKEQHEKNPYSIYGYRQALFGIIQGGSYPDLREQSTAFIVAADLDGIAIGGEAIGFDRAKTAAIIGISTPSITA